MAVGSLIAGRYRLEELLGAGGMGEVWRATDLELRRVVALKRSRRGDSGQIRREARIGAGLHHPHVVTVFDAVVHGADRWLVMEYLPSRSLDEVLRDAGPLGLPTAVRLIVQLAAAVTAMHARGMVHRDIKPGNVLVAEDGTAKLTDLGISRWAELTHTQDPQFAGTPGYLAPEVAAGYGAGPPADVFALGATFYAALVGHSPWGGAGLDPYAQLRRAAEYQLEPLPDTESAPVLAPVLAGLLARDPAHRPSAAEAYLGLVALAAELLGPRRSPSTGVGTSAAGSVTMPPPQLAPTAALRAVSSPVVSSPVVSSRVVSASVRRWERARRRGWRSRRVALGALVLAIAVAAGVALTGPFVRTEPGTAVRAVTSPVATSDAVSMDVCGLLSTDALLPYGRAQIDGDVGPFTECDLLVMTPKNAMIAVTAELHGWLANPELPQKPGVVIGPLPVPTEPAMCRRIFGLTGVYELTLTSRAIHGTGDLCAMVDAAAAGTSAVLAKGSMPRLSRGWQYPANSLARVNACGLLNDADLDARLGYTPSAEPDFGNWSCSWTDNTNIGPTAAVEFTREWPLANPDPDIGFGSPPVKIHGYNFYESVSDQGCAVAFTHLEYHAKIPAEGAPTDRDEVITVHFKEPGIDDLWKLCPNAQNLMLNIIPQLPH